MSKTSKTTTTQLKTNATQNKATTSIPTATNTKNAAAKPKTTNNATTTAKTTALKDKNADATKRRMLTKVGTNETTGLNITTTASTKANNFSNASGTASKITNAKTNALAANTTALKGKTTAKAVTTTTLAAKPRATLVNKAVAPNVRSTATSVKTTATAAKLTTNTRQVTSTASKNVVAKTNEQRSLPLRAKHSAAIVEAVRRNTASASVPKSPAKPNAVLNTYHNVTVISPPLQRKVRALVEETATQNVNELTPRPRTRTLDATEVMVLKSESAKQRSEVEMLKDAEVAQQLKEPIAFEVNFAEAPKPTRDRSNSRAKQPKPTDNLEQDSDDYADDFESYGSDFASEASTQNSTGTHSSSETSSGSQGSSHSISSANEKESEKACDTSVDSHEASDEDEEEEESELTQFPITVIQRDKECERKLDSGNYEMLSRSRPPKLNELSQQSSQQVFDLSLDTLSAGASEQLDSGISSNGNMTQNSACMTLANAVAYGGYVNFTTHPIITTRGSELMSKIQFDTLTYVLLDLKPISYDVFMQTFGKLNTTQSSAQTHDQRSAIASQTADNELRSIWTQHPPQYDLKTMQQLSGGLVGSAFENCCGELPKEDTVFGDKPCDQYEASLQALSKLRTQEDTRAISRQLRLLRKPIDCEQLNQFLRRSANLITRVLNANSNSSNVPQSRHSTAGSAPLAAISAGYRQIDTQFLNALYVVRIFASARHNLVLTVHACRPENDVYRSDFSNLLMVWSTNDTSAKPLRLLSTWSEVSRAEIFQESADIVVCGLRDGSVAMWDLRETHTFCAKLDGHLAHFAATQSIVPTLGETSISKLMDLGAVVDVKSFRAAHKGYGLTGHKTLQFVTLHDTGMLTVWTLVETGKPNKTLDQSHTSNAPRRSAKATAYTKTCEYSSPWARVKLIQSAICDLRAYLERGILKARSKFDKTKSLFQHNIYSDELLRELNETQTEQKHGLGLQGLRFTSVDVGCERIYVCSNRNFILICSKSLKPERFRKLNINESRFLFPTALRVLTNEDFLAVGLSNGSVMILNCSQSKHTALRVAPAVREEESKANAIPSTAYSNEYELETGKSCAIQNIILNERRGYESNNYADVYEQRPSTTAACLAMINEQKKPFELRVYDQQILLSGSVLRKHLIQSLELSSDGWKLFALSNGEVRSYDFFLDCELAGKAMWDDEGEDKVCDIAVASSGKNEQYLLLLNAKGEVQVHLLKQ